MSSPLGMKCCLIEFKIYISLKPNSTSSVNGLSLIEFKIYISLKLTKAFASPVKV